jgi:hypothetical protein
MMNNRENLSSGAQRTRRNIMKMGVVLGSVALGKVGPAAAFSRPQGNQGNQGNQGGQRGGGTLRGTGYGKIRER